LLDSAYQLNNHNLCWGAKPRNADCGNKSSMERTFLGAKVPRYFRSRKRKFSGAKVPGSESSIYGTFVPGSEIKYVGTKVP